MAPFDLLFLLWSGFQSIHWSLLLILWSGIQSIQSIDRIESIHRSHRIGLSMISWLVDWLTMNRWSSMNLSIDQFVMNDSADRIAPLMVNHSVVWFINRLVIIWSINQSMMNRWSSMSLSNDWLVMNDSVDRIDPSFDPSIGSNQSINDHLAHWLIEDESVITDESVHIDPWWMTPSIDWGWIDGHWWICPSIDPRWMTPSINWGWIYDHWWICPSIDRRWMTPLIRSTHRSGITPLFDPSVMNHSIVWSINEESRHQLTHDEWLHQ